MRKWKDDGSQAFPKKRKQIFTVITVGIMVLTTSTIFFSHKITYENVINISLGCFLLWGMYTGGFYKIMRKYAEWQLKKKDNHWRNYP